MTATYERFDGADCGESRADDDHVHDCLTNSLIAALIRCTSPCFNWW